MKRMTNLDWWQVTLRNAEHKPSKRWGHRCLLIGHEMVLFGGFDANYMNDLWVFDTKTLLWHQITAGGDHPPKRSNFSMCYDEVNLRIVVYGGKLPDKKSCNAVWVLDWQLKEWLKLPCSSPIMPQERKYHIAQLLYPQMIVFGGESAVDLDDLWLHNMATLQWQEVTVKGNKPRARRFHSSVIIRNCLYIVGGCFNKYEQLGDIWELNLDPLSQQNHAMLSWVNLTDAFSGNYLPRWGHSCTAKDNKIYVFGGKVAQQMNDIFEIDLSNKKISALNCKHNPTHRRRHSAVFVGASLLVFGGFNQEYFDHLYCITIKKSRPKTQRITLQQEMQRLVNNPSHSSTVLTTLDQYRLYVHIPIIRRKLGSNTEQFLDMLQRSNSKEAVKLLKTVYGLLDCSPNNRLPLSEVQNWYPIDLIQLCGYSTQSAPNVIQQRILILSEKQLHLLEARLASPQYQEPHDTLTIVEHSTQISTSSMLASLRSRYFQSLCSRDFCESNQYVLEKVRPRIFKIALRFIELDWVIVPDTFQTLEWLELLFAARYYDLENLADICENYILEILDESNINNIFQLAVTHRVRLLASECAELLVFNEALEGKQPVALPFEKTNCLQQKLSELKKGAQGELSFHIRQLLANNERENPEKAPHQ